MGSLGSLWFDLELRDKNFAARSKKAAEDFGRLQAAIVGSKDGLNALANINTSKLESASAAIAKIMQSYAAGQAARNEALGAEAMLYKSLKERVAIEDRIAKKQAHRVKQAASALNSEIAAQKAIGKLIEHNAAIRVRLEKKGIALSSTQDKFFNSVPKTSPIKSSDASTASEIQAMSKLSAAKRKSLVETIELTAKKVEAESRIVLARQKAARSEMQTSMMVSQQRFKEAEMARIAAVQIAQSELLKQQIIRETARASIESARAAGRTPVNMPKAATVAIGGNIASEEKKANDSAKARALTEKQITREKEVQAKQQMMIAQNQRSQVSLGGSILSQLKGALTMYFSIYALVRIIKDIVTTTGQFEVQKTAMRSIMQDAAAANEIFAKTKSFAVRSPFSFMDLVSYEKQLAAFGVANNELFDSTKRLADLSAGLGVDMSRIILAFGQVKAASVLRGQELRQFTEAGIPLVQELANRFSLLQHRVVQTSEVFELISDRQVPFEMVRDVLFDMTKEGGKFHNMQEIQAKTIYGKLQNLKDAWQIAMEAMGSSNSGVVHGILDVIFKILSSATTLQTILGGIIGLMTGYALKNSIRFIGNQCSAMIISFRAIKAEIVAARAAAVSFKTTVKGIGTAFWSVLPLLVMIGTAIWSAYSASLELGRALARIGSDGADEIKDATDGFRGYADAAVNAVQGTDAYEKAMKDLVRIYGDVLPAQALEIENLRALKGSYNGLTEAIRENVRAKKLEEIKGEVSKSDDAKNVDEIMGLKVNRLFGTNGSIISNATEWARFLNNINGKKLSLEDVNVMYANAMTSFKKDGERMAERNGKITAKETAGLMIKHVKIQAEAFGLALDEANEELLSNLFRMSSADPFTDHWLEEFEEYFNTYGSAVRDANVKMSGSARVEDARQAAIDFNNTIEANITKIERSLDNSKYESKLRAVVERSKEKAAAYEQAAVQLEETANRLLAKDPSDGAAQVYRMQAEKYRAKAADLRPSGLAEGLVSYAEVVAKRFNIPTDELRFVLDNAGKRLSEQQEAVSKRIEDLKKEYEIQVNILAAQMRAVTALSTKVSSIDPLTGVPSEKTFSPVSGIDFGQKKKDIEDKKRLIDGLTEFLKSTFGETTKKNSGSKKRNPALDALKDEVDKYKEFRDRFDKLRKVVGDDLAKDELRKSERFKGLDFSILGDGDEYRAFLTKLRGRAAKFGADAKDILKSLDIEIFDFDANRTKESTDRQFDAIDKALSRIESRFKRYSDIVKVTGDRVKAGMLSFGKDEAIYRDREILSYIDSIDFGSIDERKAIKEKLIEALDSGLEWGDYVDSVGGEKTLEQRLGLDTLSRFKNIWEALSGVWKDQQQQMLEFVNTYRDVQMLTQEVDNSVIDSQNNLNKSIEAGIIPLAEKELWLRRIAIAATKRKEDILREELDKVGYGSILDDDGGSDIMNKKIKAMMPFFKSINKLTLGQLNRVRDVLNDLPAAAIEEITGKLKLTEEQVALVTQALERLREEGTTQIDMAYLDAISKHLSSISSAIGSIGSAFSGLDTSWAKELSGSLSALERSASAASGITEATKLLNSKEKQDQSEGRAKLGLAAIEGIASVAGMVLSQNQENAKVQEEWTEAILGSAHAMRLLRLETAELIREKTNREIFGSDGWLNKFQRASNRVRDMQVYSKELADQIAATGAVMAGTADVVSGKNVVSGIVGAGAAGAAIGSLIPVVGTAVGAVVGGVVGGVIGLFAKKTEPVYQALRDRFGEIYNPENNEISAELLANYESLDPATKKFVDRLKEAVAKAKEARDEMKGLLQDVLGEISTKFYDSMIEAFKNDDLTRAMLDFENQMYQIIGKVVSQQLVSQLVFKAIMPSVEQIEGLLNSSGQINDINKMTELFMTAGGRVKNTSASVMQMLKVFDASMGGILSRGLETNSSLKSGIQGMTENTAQILAAYMNSVRQDTRTIALNQQVFSELSKRIDDISVAARHMANLEEIKNNTKRSADNTEKIANTISKLTTKNSGVVMNV